MAFSVDSALQRWKRLARGEVSTDASEATPLLSSSKKGLLHTLEKQRVVHPNNLRCQKDWKVFSRYYCDNTTRTTRYSLLGFLPKNLLEQFYRFANLYFLFLAILNWMPQVEVFHKEITMIPLAIVLAVVAIKDGLEDLKRYQVDRRINHLKTTVYRKLFPCDQHRKGAEQDRSVLQQNAFCQSTALAPGLQDSCASTSRPLSEDPARSAA